MLEGPVKERFARLERLGGFGSWEYDPMRDSLWWSEGLCALYGVPSTSAPATLVELERLIPEEDWPRALVAYTRPTPGVPIVHRIRLPGGEQRWVRVTGGVETRLDGTPLVAGVVAVSSSASAPRKGPEASAAEAVRMLQTALDAIPVRVFWKDLQCTFLGCNAAFAKDAGLQEPRQLVGLTDLQMVWKEQADAYRRDDRAVMQSGIPKLNYEEPQTTPLGETIWLRTSKIPLRNSSGDIIGVLGTYEDITQYKLAQQESQHREKLEAIGRLAGGVAHDFNNLLTVIIGSLEVLKWEMGTGKIAPGTLERMEDAAQRAANLTRQLLAFARRQIVAPRIIDLGQQLRDLRNLLATLLGEVVELRIDVAETSSPVLMDPGQFEQLIVNLAANARDAMPQGGKLHIVIRNVSVKGKKRAREPELRPGQYVKIVVRDTGGGMESDVQEHAFEPFFTTKGMGRGTGLGLATCHGIVRQNGGHIRLLSIPGKGTTFEIHLPRAQQLQEEAEPNKPSSMEDIRGSERVLFVEDEPSLRELGARSLRTLGYHVVSASTGAEALELARTAGPFDALITDIVLPDIRGPEVSRRLLARFPQLRVLYVSGYTDDASVHSGTLEEGVNFLPKPYAPARLARLLRRILSG
jgi:two-component system cell cycle sensor histidine kinase/response regulator CckA